MRIPSILSASALATALLLAGCGATPFAPTSTTRPAAIAGKVHGGQQPITSAAIQLYTVGTTGDGSASTPLLTATVQTDANGFFNISNSPITVTLSGTAY